MQQIELNNKVYQLPESWAEVCAGKNTSKLLPQLIDLLFMRAETGETYHELLRVLLGISRKVWKKTMHYYFHSTVSDEAKTQSAEALQQLLRVIDWMWKEPVLVRPFEHFEYKGEKYFLPEENFQTTSWGELKDAYVHCEAFGRQLVPGEQHLDLLVSTICRPERRGDYMNESWNGDIRENYNEFVSKARAKELSKISFAQKFSVLLYFAGSIKALLDSYDIYPKGDGIEEITEVYIGQGFEENTLALAEKSIFGNYAQTGATNCHNILIALERNKRILEAEIEASKHDSNR